MRPPFVLEKPMTMDSARAAFYRVLRVWEAMMRVEPHTRIRSRSMRVIGRAWAFVFASWRVPVTLNVVFSVPAGKSTMVLAKLGLTWRAMLAKRKTVNTAESITIGAL